MLNLERSCWSTGPCRTTGLALRSWRRPAQQPAALQPAAACLATGWNAAAQISSLGCEAGASRYLGRVTRVRHPRPPKHTPHWGWPPYRPSSEKKRASITSSTAQGPTTVLILETLAPTCPTANCLPRKPAASCLAPKEVGKDPFDLGARTGHFAALGRLRVYDPPPDALEVAPTSALLPEEGVLPPCSSTAQSPAKPPARPGIPGAGLPPS